MKVKYLGYGTNSLKIGKTYEVLTIEDGWYRVMNENSEEELLPSRAFEIVDGDENNVVLIVSDEMLFVK